jgi:hypothetical protein
MQGYLYDTARRQYYSDGLGWNPLGFIGNIFTGGSGTGNAPGGSSLLLRPVTTAATGDGALIGRVSINPSGNAWTNWGRDILNAGVGLTSQWIAGRSRNPTQQIITAPPPTPQPVAGGAPTAGEASGGGSGAARGDNAISLSERDGVRGSLNISPTMIWLGIGAVVLFVALNRKK